jgi:hypothetical protein
MTAIRLCLERVLPRLRDRATLFGLPQIHNAPEVLDALTSIAEGMHFFWWEEDETRDAVDARIRAKIASGEASPNDRFVTFTWTRPEREAGSN